MLLTIFTLLVLLFSVIIHEIAHGSVAYYLGDPTAKYSGRLTLNPLKHLDPFGSIILPLLLLFATAGQGPIFGWAKPVPINPFNFRDQKWGNLKVAIAGPATNFFIAIIFGLALRFVPMPPELITLFSIISLYNFLWGIFNLVPIPPLDGSWILFSFLSDKYASLKATLSQYGIVLLLLFFFIGIQWISYLASFFFSLVSGQPI